MITHLKTGLVVALLLIAAGSTSAAAQDAAGAPPTKKLNLNTATAEEFLTVPGVGNRMVREFNEYRPYVSIQQFRREIGKYVDEDVVTGYEAYVFVPVSPNGSDEPTVMQLPGVTQEIAAQLVAGRPYASNEAFLGRLGELLSAEDAAQGASYLTSP